MYTHHGYAMPDKDKRAIISSDNFRHRQCAAANDRDKALYEDQVTQINQTVLDMQREYAPDESV